MSNEFIPFCPTDSGTNLLTQAAYTASSDRTLGNQPGVASAKLNNKAIRQATAVAASFAQYVADSKGVNVLDDGVAATLLTQINGAFSRNLPIFTTYLSGSGTFNKSYVFNITAGSATVGATYTNNGNTYTVKATVASATKVIMTGSAAPLAEGTLTKSAGTGDSSLIFKAVTSALYIRVRAVGGGGGGGGSSTTAAANGGTGGTGGTTTFGTSLITCTGGSGGPSAGNGGSGGGTTLGALATGIALQGGGGGSGSNATTGFGIAGGNGGSSAFGGNGSSAAAGGTATAGATNTGSGGGGAGTPSGNFFNGAGGGAGGFIDAQIDAPLSTYAYAVGAAGTAGTAGTGGSAGAAGGSGMIIVQEYFQ